MAELMTNHEVRPIAVKPVVREAIRKSVEEMRRVNAIPAEEFGGHKGIFLANQEGFLGGHTFSLLEAMEQLEAFGDRMAHRLRESEDVEDRLMADEWMLARGVCRVCCGPLEGSPGPECAEDGCPSRDGSDA